MLAELRTAAAEINLNVMSRPIAGKSVLALFCNNFVINGDGFFSIKEIQANQVLNDLVNAQAKQVLFTITRSLLLQGLKEKLPRGGFASFKDSQEAQNFLSSADMSCVWPNVQPSQLFFEFLVAECDFEKSAIAEAKELSLTVGVPFDDSRYSK